MTLNKLVYVGDGQYNNIPENKVPVFGDVYTVASVAQYQHIQMPFLILVEFGMPYSYPLYDFVLEAEYKSVCRQLDSLLREAKIIFQK